MVTLRGPSYVQLHTLRIHQYSQYIHINDSYRNNKNEWNVISLKREIIKFCLDAWPWLLLLLLLSLVLYDFVVDCLFIWCVYRRMWTFNKYINVHHCRIPVFHCRFQIKIRIYHKIRNDEQTAWRLVVISPHKFTTPIYVHITCVRFIAEG